MMMYDLVIILSSLMGIANSGTRRRKNDTVQKFHRTGEAIAVDCIIQEYEKEHRKFYNEKINGGDYLGWPALENKNLSDYCSLYLNESIPRRTNHGATGIKIMRSLHYEKGNIRTLKKVVIVRCKLIHMSQMYVYYITRAPKPNCVYALKSRGNLNYFILTIINKYCDFEEISRKRKAIEIFTKMHRKTGQRIADDDHLIEYELDHRELLNKERYNGELLEWPREMVHPNLNIFCYQYMRKAVPGRNRKNVKGSWKTEKLHYQKLNTNECNTSVTTIRCHPADESKLTYYVTRASEKNCVYALLRMGRGAYNPLVIIFKYCGFSKPNYEKTTLAEDYDVHNKDVIPNSEVKEGLGATASFSK